MIDRWENAKYLVFSSNGDRCCGFLKASPKFLGFSLSRIEKYDVLVVGLGAYTKYMHISTLYANNLYWKV